MGDMTSTAFSDSLNSASSDIISYAEAAEARVRASLEDLKAGRVRRFASAEALIRALDLED